MTVQKHLASYSLNTVTRSYRIHTCFPFNLTTAFLLSGTCYFSYSIFLIITLKKINFKFFLSFICFVRTASLQSFILYHRCVQTKYVCLLSEVVGLATGTEVHVSSASGIPAPLHPEGSCFSRHDRSQYTCRWKAPGSPGRSVPLFPVPAPRQSRHIRFLPSR